MAGGELDPAPLVVTADVHGSTTNEVDAETVYTTSEFGQSLLETDELGNLTEYVRNPHGDATETTLASGTDWQSVLQNSFAESGNMVLSIGPGPENGHRLHTAYVYDETWNVPTSVLSFDGFYSPSPALSWYASQSARNSSDLASVFLSR